MRKILPFLFAPLLLVACAPFKKPVDSYSADVGKLYSARQLWESQQKTTFQLKQLYLQVSANRKAIEELNRQMEKQNRINKEFAGKLLTIEREVAELQKLCSNSTNSTAPKGGKEK